jgi:hypothetical protein
MTYGSIRQTWASLMGPVMSSPRALLSARVAFHVILLGCGRLSVQQASTFDCHGTPCDLATEYSLLFVVSAVAAQHDAIRGNGETDLGTAWFVRRRPTAHVAASPIPRPGDGTSAEQGLVQSACSTTFDAPIRSGNCKPAAMQATSASFRPSF